MNSAKLACLTALLITASVEYAAAPPVKSHGLDIAAIHAAFTWPIFAAGGVEGTGVSSTPT